MRRARRLRSLSEEADASAKRARHADVDEGTVSQDAAESSAATEHSGFTEDIDDPSTPPSQASAKLYERLERYNTSDALKDAVRRAQHERYRMGTAQGELSMIHSVGCRSIKFYVSGSSGHTYRVRLRATQGQGDECAEQEHVQWSCTCEDFARRDGLLCKHAYFAARNYCGGRFNPSTLDTTFLDLKDAELFAGGATLLEARVPAMSALEAATTERQLSILVRHDRGG